MVSNDSIHLSPGPLFSGNGYFGDAFANAIKFPADFKSDKLSGELILEFKVNDKGASNFKINQGVSESLDKEVLRVMGNLGKKWRLNEINPKPCSVRFHMYFIKTNEQFIVSFKID